MLTLLVEGAGLAKVPAQALAVGLLDAAELPRQQALELPLAGLSDAWADPASEGRLRRMARCEPIL